MKKNEIEVRSFISQTEYRRLSNFFNKKAKFLADIKEETIYFKGSKGDLRLRKNQDKTLIIFKKGKIHDDFREELEIELNKRYFQKFRNLFKNLGLKEEIQWFRKRKIYQLSSIKVFLDDTKGYGLIIELEKFSDRGDQKNVYNQLKKKLKDLGVKITPKSIFDKKFNYYKKNWRKILK